MTETATRTAPQAFIDLAEQALRGGALDRVFIGFEHLDSDFPAPIGWVLGMHRVDPIVLAQTGLSDIGNRMIVDAQIGSEPSAVAGVGLENFDAVEIEQWINYPRATGIGSPIFGLGDIDRVMAAVRNGWAVTREITRLGQHVSITYTFEAGNHFFNHEGSPSHRSTGAPVSRQIGLVFTMKSRALENAYAAFVDGLTVTPAVALAEIAERAPWYADVAYFDDDHGGWIR